MDSHESPTSGATDDSQARPKGIGATLWPWAKNLPYARTLKYAVLLTALAVTLRIVFDGYSFYIARRDIDSELQSKKGYSFEYLDVLARRKRALILATLETRCLERTELTLFR